MGGTLRVLTWIPGVGNCLTLGVGNYLIPPLGNCLTLEGLSLGNYLIADKDRVTVVQQCVYGMTGVPIAAPQHVPTHAHASPLRGDRLLACPFPA